VPPVLSFIVPVRNDADRLRECLESIRRATAAIESEIIVADNGSSDGSVDVARAAGARVLEMPDRRVSELRNAAARFAGAPLLAFVDADHEIDPAWSETALRGLDEPAVVAVGAPYRAPADGTWVQRMYDRFRRHRPGSRVVDWLPSGNFAVRRSSFESVGGFDTTLETCEDVDFCQRLRRQGGRLLAIDRLRSVHHGDPRTLKALFLGELWRGRNNLRVSLSAPLTLRGAPSVLVPVLNLLALLALIGGLATWRLGGWRIALGGAGLVALLTIVRGISLVWHPGATDRDARLAAQAIVVAAVYDMARALALVSRSGHDVRRRT
jgi:GT2 family glycosyltransferase